MKTFMGIYRPSDALFALADGLEQRQDGQLIDMGSYGHISEDGVCFGCAATWALQQLHGAPLPNAYFAAVDENERCPGAEANRHYGDRADALAVDTEDLYRFEEAMNLARLGSLFPLFDFFEIHTKDQEMIFSQVSDNPTNLWRLNENTWKEELPHFREFAETLKEMGF